MYYIYLFYSFFIILFLGLLFILGVKKNISKELHFCTKQITNLQHSHKKLTKSLFAKNSSALALRISRVSAEILYIAAPFHAKPAAKIALQTIKNLQEILTVYQKSLISTANIQSHKLSSKMFVHGHVTIKPSTGLYVKAYPKNSDSPSYRLQDDYQNKKKLIFSKTINVTKGFPKILKNLVKLDSYFALTCGATIKEKGGVPSNIKLILDK